MEKNSATQKGYNYVVYWDSLVGYTADVVLSVDLDLNITYINHRIEDYIGPRKNFLGSSYRSLGLSKADADVWLNTLRCAAISKKSQTMVFNMEGVPSKNHQFESTVNPVMDADNNTTSFTLLMRDQRIKSNRKLNGNKWESYRVFVSNLMKALSDHGKSDIDAMINQVLKATGEFFELDRSYIFIYNFESGSVCNTHEWCADGISSEKDNLKDIPLAMVPEWVGKHCALNPLIINDVKSLNPKSFTRQSLESQNIKSLITYPVLDDGKCMGFIGCDAVVSHRIFSESDVDFLSLVAELVGNLKPGNVSSLAPISTDASAESKLLNAEIQIQTLREFAYMASHNFLGHINNILGLTDHHFPKGAESTDYEKQLRESVIGIKQSFESMAAYLRSTNTVVPKPKQIKLSDCFARASKLLRKEINDSGINITTQWEVDKVRYYNMHIDNLMYNLMSNAIKYRDPSKSAELQIKAMPTKDGGAELTFTDNGTGIDLKKIRNRIFGLYQRFHKDIPGNGVGLYTIKSQLNRYGSSIDVESKPGVGTIFTIVLSKQT